MEGFPLNDWSQFKLKNHFIFNVSMFYKDKHNARPKFESQILRPKRDTYLICLMDRYFVKYIDRRFFSKRFFLSPSLL